MRPYLSAIATAVFFSLSLLDCGALTWAMTGLRSLFINSNTLSGFYTDAKTETVKELNMTAALKKYFNETEQMGEKVTEEKVCSPLPAHTVGPPPQTSLCSRPREPLY